MSTTPTSGLAVVAWRYNGLEGWSKYPPRWQYVEKFPEWETGFSLDALVLESDALAEITALRGEIEALKADAMRVDWLEAMVGEFSNIDRITSVRGKFNGLPSLRAAIDAAMAQAKPDPT